MRRAVTFVALSLLLASCGGGEGSRFTVPPTTAGTSTPAGVTTTSGPGTTAATSTTAPAGGAEVVVWQILQRWDGALPLGSFEATVCNLGPQPAMGLEAVLTANGFEVRVTLPEVPARGCVDAYDPASTFAGFGVEAGQTVTVRAAVLAGGAEVASREEAVAVDLRSPEPTPEVLEAYTWCMENNEPVHGNCVPLSARTAFAEPHEVMKQAGRYTVITPAEWEPLASMTVADMAICLPRLEEYLGIPLPRLSTPLVWHYSESTGYTWFGAAEGIQQITPAAADFYEGVLSGQFTQHSWESIFRGLCSEAHETTHILTNEFQGMPRWLNEGLAVYMGNAERTNWYSRSYYRCEETGYVDINYLNLEETFVPYVALGIDPLVADTAGPYYATGACFWTYFESTFGHEALLAVMDALEQTREVPGGPFQGCPKFLDLVTPVIGEDISALTQERFGFGRDYARCSLGG